MDVNSQPSATCFAISVKNPELPPNRIAPIAMLNSREQRHEMGTWSMESANREGLRTIDEDSSLTA